MGKHRFAAELGMAVEEYWYQKDTAAFRALQCTVLDLKEVVVLDTRPNPDGSTFVLLRTVPNVEIPKSLLRFLGGKDFVFDDELTYPATVPPYTSVAKSIPPIYPQKANIRAILTCTATGAFSCKQVLEVDIQIKVLGLSGLIEGIVVDGLRKSYALLPKLVEEWKRVRPTLPEYQQDAAPPRTLASFSVAVDAGLAGLDQEESVEGAADELENPLSSQSMTLANFKEGHTQKELQDASQQWNIEVRKRTRVMAKTCSIQRDSLYSIDDLAKYAANLELAEVDAPPAVA